MRQAVSAPLGRGIRIVACVALVALTCSSVQGFQLRGGKARLNAPAPELEGGTEWLNTAGPLSLKDLRGKIVLLDFWTYCCINCMHILPDLEKLEEKYSDELVVIGVHSGKFSAERDADNIRQAILRYHIKHPVVNDSEKKIWKTYGANWWPTFCVIDPEGRLVHATIQENKLVELDQVIGELVRKHRAKGTLNSKPLQFDTLKLAERKNAPIYFPGKVLADEASKRLFIADSSHHRIVITDLDGKHLDTAGSGEVGSKDGDFEEAEFDDPQGMALQGDILYVADRRNCLIRKLDLKARTVQTFAGTGEQRYVPRQPALPALRAVMNSPWDLWIEGDQLFVALAGNHQIWRIDLATRIAVRYAGAGDENIRDGRLEQALFSQPSGLTSDGTWLYVADAEVSAIRAVALRGNSVRTLVGTGLFDFGDKDGTGKAAKLQHALAVQHHQGKLYIADTYNNKIKVLDLKNRECKTWLGDGQPGLADEPARFHEPGGLSIAAGRLYVADTNNHAVRVIDLETKAVSTLKLSGVTPPKAPSESTRPIFTNPTVSKVEQQAIPLRGNLVLRINVKLAENVKLNPEIPAVFLVEGNLEGEKEPFEAQGTIAKPGEGIAITLPADKLAKARNLKVSLQLYACKTGKEGICFPTSQVWDIAVSPQAAGRPSLELETKEITSSF